MPAAARDDPFERLERPGRFGMSEVGVEPRNEVVQEGQLLAARRRESIGNARGFEALPRFPRPPALAGPRGSRAGARIPRGEPGPAIGGFDRARARGCGPGFRGGVGVAERGDPLAMQARSAPVSAAEAKRRRPRPMTPEPSAPRPSTSSPSARRGSRPCRDRRTASARTFCRRARGRART